MRTATTSEEWRQIASRSFVPLECEAPTTAFRASIVDIRLRQGLSLGHICSDAAVITRTQRLAARATSDDLHISLQVRSSGRIHQGSARATMAPGAVAVYATHLPYRLDYFAPGQRLIVLQISRSELALPATAMASATNSIGVPDTAARRVFASYLCSLVSAQDGLDELTRDDFARVTVELATTMLRSADAAHSMLPGSPEALLYTVQSFIRDRALSAELTVDDIARTHFISRRKLYQLFAQDHTTPSAYLREERLKVASCLLVDPNVREPISAVAAMSGFADLTTFTRAFRRRFGMTPRDWRRSGGLGGTEPLA